MSNKTKIFVDANNVFKEVKLNWFMKVKKEIKFNSYAHNKCVTNLLCRGFYRIERRL